MLSIFVFVMCLHLRSQRNSNILRSRTSFHRHPASTLHNCNDDRAFLIMLISLKHRIPCVTKAFEWPLLHDFAAYDNFVLQSTFPHTFPKKAWLVTHTQMYILIIFEHLQFFDFLLAQTGTWKPRVSFPDQWGYWRLLGMPSRKFTHFMLEILQFLNGFQWGAYVPMLLKTHCSRV